MLLFLPFNSNSLKRHLYYLILESPSSNLKISSRVSVSICNSPFPCTLRKQMLWIRSVCFFRIVFQQLPMQRAFKVKTVLKEYNFAHGDTYVYWVTKQHPKCVSSNTSSKGHWLSGVLLCFVGGGGAVRIRVLMIKNVLNNRGKKVKQISWLWASSKTSMYTLWFFKGGLPVPFLHFKAYRAPFWQHFGKQVF